MSETIVFTLKMCRHAYFDMVDASTVIQFSSKVTQIMQWEKDQDFYSILCYVLVMLCLSTFSASQPTIEIQIWSQWLVVKDHFHPKAKKNYMLFAQRFFSVHMTHL